MNTRGLLKTILLTSLCLFLNVTGSNADDAKIAGRWILNIGYPRPFTVHTKVRMCPCTGECMEDEGDAEGQLPPKDGYSITQDDQGAFSGEYSYTTEYSSALSKITGNVTGNEIKFTRIFKIEAHQKLGIFDIKSTVTFNETYTGTVIQNNIKGAMKGSYNAEEENTNYADPHCPVVTYLTSVRQYDGPFSVKLPTPVMLLHGIWDDASTCWKDVTNALDKEGLPWFAPSFCQNNGPIESNAAVLADIISKLSGPGNVFDIVAHSMGGLAARYYLAHDELWPMDISGNHQHRVRKLITLGTPHLGTDLHLLHPIASSKAELHNMECKTDCLNIYLMDNNFRVWSPGLREMTAVWKPPSEWDSKEVMPRYERLAACFLKGLYGGEWAELCDLFPPTSNKVTLKKHVAYYNTMIRKLTGSEGCSPFLQDLNSIPIPGDVSYYLIRGNSPRMSYNFFCGPQMSIPFLKADYGDGAVPPESAWGQGLNFPAKTKIWEVKAKHIDLPKASIGRIIKYLKAKPSQGG
jgi:pimeloyl-ACP methyl ester carboxylesterase